MNIIVALCNFSARLVNKCSTIAFKNIVNDCVGPIYVAYPFYVKNPQYIKIGRCFSACTGLRIEAWNQYENETFQPRITIGDNVCMNFRVHIGAIKEINIGDNVLIGSNVLITDHSHGDTNETELMLPPAKRKLRCKGPVHIERDVWIGENVCILSGVRLGRNCIIGCNSVVTKDVPANAVAAGVPAKVIKQC